VNAAVPVAPFPHAASAASGRPAPAQGRADGEDVAAERPQAVLVAVSKILVREGLLRLLEEAGLGAGTVVAADAGRLRELLGQRSFDLVLVDPPLAAAADAAQMQARSRRILLVTDRDHPGQAPIAGAEVACGMLSESLGETATRCLLQTLLACRRERSEAAECCSCSARATWAQASLPLSPRELEIFRAIGAGMGPQRIATALGLSVKTVETHREKIKQKLGLDGADALLCAATRWCQGYRIGTGSAVVEAPSQRRAKSSGGSAGS
jgi:DNA-binding NarL/FixJ family response regulator